MSLFSKVFKGLEFKKKKLPKKKLKLIKRNFKKSNQVVLLVDLQKSGIIVASSPKSVDFFGCTSEKTFHKNNYENLLPIKQHHLNLSTQTLFTDLVQESINGKNDYKDIYHQTIHHRQILTRAYYTPIMINRRLHLQCLLRETEINENNTIQENETIPTNEKLSSKINLKFINNIKKITEKNTLTDLNNEDEKEEEYEDNDQNNEKKQNTNKRGEEKGKEYVKIDIKTEYENFFENINTLLHSSKDNNCKSMIKQKLEFFQVHFNNYFDEEQIQQRYLIIQKERDHYQDAIKALRKYIKEIHESLDIYLGGVSDEKEKKRNLLNQNFKLKQEIKKLKQKIK
ncbi:hypothetical protein M0812_06852 [Anaeramoeba flamelloides]|uniref:MADS-box domain-containing protein n=1 Tax=Anaeramoeba flamelloides TaxID=1746091 RepID=A0AAV8A8Q5_9EUKA|nr:hypothetical protein M0812_06852 [Anaeramoeba flamelloides]